MNKLCSERAWCPPSSTPCPPIKEIWVSAWLLPLLFTHPLLIPGIITLTRMGPTPCKAPPQPLACQVGPLDWTQQSTPIPACLSKTMGRGLDGTQKSSSLAFCSACGQRFLQ